jgi:alkanesulfonate monooxygenase SsuD/methylene tetrahydromethanopterin reductase-like flavin-dependent oxidoreductase (luciferase family)
MKALDPELLAEFAQRVEAGPFASLGLGERLTFDCYDPMIALTYAAAVTSRIKFMTTVLCLPFHKEGVVAKQALSLDRLSKGRFRLGLGLGGRPKDFEVSPAEWKNRGVVFEGQLRTIKRIWAGEAPYEDADVIGPSPYTPGGPELIIGGSADKALERAGRLADGIRSFSFSPDVDEHLRNFAVVQKAWDTAGRSGRPRLYAAVNFALGPAAQDAYEGHVKSYYGYDPELVARATSSRAPTTPDAVRDFILRCQDAGVDELCFTALTTDPMASLDPLAEVVASL